MDKYCKEFSNFLLHSDEGLIIMLFNYGIYALIRRTIFYEKICMFDENLLKTWGASYNQIFSRTIIKIIGNFWKQIVVSTATWSTNFPVILGAPYNRVFR